MSCEIIDFRAAEIDFYKENNDDFLITFEVYDNDDLPILLDDYTNVEFVVNEIIVAELGYGITISGNVVSITKSDTTIEGEYEYLVAVYDADGARRTIVQGKMIIE